MIDDVLSMYSVSEFVAACGKSGKFFELEMGLIKRGLKVLKSEILRSLGPSLMLFSSTMRPVQEVWKSWEDSLKLYKEAELSDLEEIKKKIKGDHDRADLMAATRVPFVIFFVIKTTSFEKSRSIEDYERLLWEVDQIHGLNPNAQLMSNNETT